MLSIRDNVKTEFGRKHITAGAMCGDTSTGSMCTLSLKCPLPGPRIHAFVAAFRSVNADSLAAIAKDAVSSLSGLQLEVGAE